MNIVRQLCSCLFTRGDPQFASEANKKEVSAWRDEEAGDSKEQLIIEEKKPTVEESVTEKGAAHLNDFNRAGDDVKEINQSKLQKMDRYQRFEKQFPFYRMDVNGYILRIKEAMAIEEPDKELWQVENIMLASLVKAFESHDSWNDLQNEDSKFVKFLNEVCAAEEEGMQNKFSCHKIRVLGLLWCEGDDKEKCHELYDNMQDNNQPTIACSDRDFLPNFYGLLDMASSMVFKCEKLYSNEDAVGPCPYTDEKIQEIKDEKYEELSEAFLDQVFDVESKLTRADWEKAVIQKQNFLFDPTKVRKALGY